MGSATYHKHIITLYSLSQCGEGIKKSTNKVNISQLCV